MKIYFILIIYLCATNGKHLGGSKRDAFDPAHEPSDAVNGSTVNNYTFGILLQGINHTQEEIIRINRNSNQSIISEKQSTNSSPAWYTSNKIQDSNSPTAGVTNLNTSPEIIQNNYSVTSDLASTNTPGRIQTNNSSGNQSSKAIFDDRPHKPRIIVTFLNTSKLKKNHTEPVYFDPFQRILQLFLSTFIRDLTEPEFPYDRHENRFSSCGHGHGFSCPRCMAAKRETKNNTVLNLLPENTALSQGSVAAKIVGTKPTPIQSSLKQEDKVRNLSHQGIYHEVEILRLTRDNLNPPSADVKISYKFNYTSQNLTDNHPTSPNTVGNLENQHFSKPEPTICSEGSKSNFTHGTLPNNPMQLLQLNSRKRDANLNNPQIIDGKRLDEQKSTNFTSDINKMITNSAHDNLRAEPTVILLRDSVISRKPRDAVRIEDFSSTNHSADRNNTEKIVVIDGRINSSLDVNSTKDQQSPTGSNFQAQKVPRDVRMYLSSIPLHLQKPPEESKLIVSEGVKLKRQTGNADMIASRDEQTSILDLNLQERAKEFTVLRDQRQNILAPKDVNIQKSSDLNPHTVSEESIVTRLTRNTNIPLRRDLQKIADDIKLQTVEEQRAGESIVSREHQTDVNQQKPTQEATILRTQRDAKILTARDLNQQQATDLKPHAVKDLNLQQRTDESKESSTLLVPKDLKPTDESKLLIKRNLDSLSPPINVNLQKAPGESKLLKRRDLNQQESHLQQNPDESSIVYANVKEGVVSFHKTNQRNQTSNLTRMKYSVVNEKRATPLIEIVNLKTNEMTNGSLNQEAPTSDEGLEVNVEAKYSYTTSSDTLKFTKGDEEPTGNVNRSELSTATEKIATLPPPKHLNHYFLSISGDAGKSVAALDDSDSDEFTRMDSSFTRISEMEVDDSNNSKFLSSDSEADVDLNLPDTQVGFGNLQSANEDEQNTLDSTSEEYSYSSTVAEIEFPPPLDRDPEKPPTLYYSKLYYIFTVTLPVVAAVGLLLTGLCFCLRSSGYCCRLFLTDPTTEIKN